MATRNLTRNTPPTRKPARTRVLKKPPSPDGISDALHQELMQLIRKLQLTLSVVTASVKALRAQGADQDEDIAVVLQRYVGDALDLEIQKWDSLMSHRATRPTT